MEELTFPLFLNDFYREFIGPLYEEKVMSSMTASILNDSLKQKEEKLQEIRELEKQIKKIENPHVQSYERVSKDLDSVKNQISVYRNEKYKLQELLSRAKEERNKIEKKVYFGDLPRHKQVEADDTVENLEKRISIVDLDLEGFFTEKKRLTNLKIEFEGTEKKDMQQSNENMKILLEIDKRKNEIDSIENEITKIKEKNFSPSSVEKKLLKFVEDIKPKMLKHIKNYTSISLSNLRLQQYKQNVESAFLRFCEGEAVKFTTFEEENIFSKSIFKAIKNET